MKSWIVICVFLTSLCSAQTVIAQWTDITPFPMKYTTGETMGVSFSDIDGDGDDDLLIATGAMVGGETLLFINDGLGNFTDATAGIFEEHHKVWTPILGDSDNDGDVDLFFVNFGEQCRLYENQGDLNFVELESGGIFQKAGNMMARGGAWVDYDSDGLLDIMVSTNAAKWDVERDKLYRNMGGNIFEDVSPEVFGDLSIGRGIVWGDFDNDGDQDLYAVGGKGCPCNWEEMPSNWLTYAENRMFRNDDGVFTDVTNDVTRDIMHGRGVAAGDYDNDGDLDLYICNVGITGEEGDNPESMMGYNRLLRNDGDFQFVDVTPAVLLQEGGERSCSWFDFDNDGDIDLIETVMWDGFPTVGLYENVNAGESFNWILSIDAFSMPIYEGNSGTGGGIADIDNDGDLDVMLGYKFGPNQLLRNDYFTGNHWIKIKLEGTVSNRDAIGARVVVRTGAIEQMREVQTGVGYWSQHSLVQHVGIGELNVIDEVRITWPSGIQQVIQFPEIDQTLLVIESDSTCIEDITNDGEVNVHDLLALISQWGDCGKCTADFNGDGVVKVQDLLILIAAWGSCT